MNSFRNSIGVRLFLFCFALLSGSGGGQVCLAGEQGADIAANRKWHSVAVNKRWGLDVKRSSWLFYFDKDGKRGAAVSGYAPFEFEIKNRRKEPRKLRFVFSSGLNSGASYVHNVDVPSKGVCHVRLFVPLQAKRKTFDPFSDNSVVAKLEDGETGDFCCTLLNAKALKSPDAFYLGCSSSLYNHASLWDRKIEGLCVGCLDAQDQEADPRVYSSMDGYMMDWGEWKSLDGKRQAALLEWVAGGGRLFMNQGQPEGIFVRGDYGRGMLVPISFDPASKEDLANAYRLVAERNALNEYGDFRIPSLEWWAKLEDYTRFVIPGWLMVLFGVFVPLFGFYMWKICIRRQGKSVLLVMPLVSLGVFGATAGYLVSGDGWHGRGKRVALVYLSPEAPSAWIFQSQIQKSGSSDGTDFFLEKDVLMSVEDRPEQDKYLGNRFISLVEQSCREEDRARGYFDFPEWMRVHLIRYVPDAGMSVECVGIESGNPVVQMASSVVLKDFLYRDYQGRIWGSSELHPGRRTRLEPDAQPFREKECKLLKEGRFCARGEPASLAPIETVRSLKWEDEIYYEGTVGNFRSQ